MAGNVALDEDDYLEGDRTKVQLSGMYTTTLRIGEESLEVFPESFKEMYEALRIEYGWGDLVFNDKKGNFISEESPLEGEVFKVREVIYRTKCATVQFPGESAWTTIYKDSGRDIKRWIKQEVQARCKVRVIPRRWVPIRNHIAGTTTRSSTSRPFPYSTSKLQTEA
jgi:hypothetical protein